MKLHILTLVLDGAPWIYHHLPIFNSLPMQWHWTIIEGAASPVKDTSWCKPIPPRLSMDGTHEYLKSLSNHPRITHIYEKIWDGKTYMCNTALALMQGKGILLQMDSDEIWSRDQIVRLCEMMDNTGSDHATFDCQYFVGPNITVDRSPGTWTNSPDMWLRAWRFEPGMYFSSHEPPILEGDFSQHLTRKQTMDAGLVFQHYAYATEKQVAFKEQYYGYEKAVIGWKRLQVNTKWPAKLRDYFSWIKDETQANKIYEY
jgi:hypothetical protein